MEVLKENSADIDIGSSAESFRDFLDTQRELFHSQVDQLRNIVVTQCRLTGVNPLAQEMAAGAMSVNIGKRPRDLLNPKAVTYMQAVFSIKDAISKKESREISALFGVTVTQVREFFASQRSRVRRLVRLSRERAVRSNECKEPADGLPSSSESSDPLIPIEPTPLNSVGPNDVEKAPSSSAQDDTLSGIADLDRHFVENIFGLMRKEETFSGQAKLMEWILQMRNSVVLNWFLSKGGVMILATWLSQAAVEEQTSVLLVILNVLCHLPLHKALPEHMSAILQSVNRLRFYRTSDISNRARVLLSKWSKLFARSQAMRKPNGMKSSNTPSEIILKQSIGEIMSDESWQSAMNIPEEILAVSHESSDIRKLESPLPLKLLPAPSDDSARKHALGVSSSHGRERRKVQLVEQPGQKLAGRSPLATRSVSVSQGRPMSADDIQKAKLRAQYMQSKYGKSGTSVNGNTGVKPESTGKPSGFSSNGGGVKPEASRKSSTSQTKNLSPVSKVQVQPKVEDRKLVIPPQNVSNRLEARLSSKEKMDSMESLGEKCRRFQIPWQIPPEVKLNDLWRVGAGESSKEVEVQKNRNRREMETIYRAVQDIPFNPKEPWDLEIDYDDTLTPEIPSEQPPDADTSETQVSRNEQVSTAGISIPSTIHKGAGAAPEPDLELLAVLLKNPELVFALTSGQAGNLSSEDMVKLLDMIKAGEAGLGNDLNGNRGRVEEKAEVSLPSPTPSANPRTNGWRPKEVSNPWSQQNPTGGRAAYTTHGVASTVFSAQRLLGPSSSQQLPVPMHSLSLRQTTTMATPPPYQTLLTGSPNIHKPTSEIVLTVENQTNNITRTSLQSLSAAAGVSSRAEAVSNIKPSPIPIIVDASDRQPNSFPLPSFLSMPPRPQTPQQQALLPGSLHITAPYPARPIGNVGPLPDSWRAREGLVLNPRSQANQNIYDASFGGPVQHSLRSGLHRMRSEYVGQQGFESWSPPNSPTRSPTYMPGRNFPEPRMSSGWSYTPDGSRQRNPSGHRDYNRQSNQRSRDRRH